MTAALLYFTSAEVICDTIRSPAVRVTCKFLLETLEASDGVSCVLSALKSQVLRGLFRTPTWCAGDTYDENATTLATYMLRQIILRYLVYRPVVRQFDKSLKEIGLLGATAQLTLRSLD